MDKKRTQRILGVLVIIALIIILFPLLFGKNEAPTQTSNVTPPPFPDQQQASAPPAVADADNANSSPATNGDNQGATTDSPATQPEDSIPTPSSDNAPAASSQPSDPNSAMPPVSSNTDTNNPSAVSDSANQAAPTDSSSAAPPASHTSSEQDAPEASPAIATDINHNNVNAVKTAEDKPADVIPNNMAKKTNIEDQPVIPVESDHAIKHVASAKVKKTVAPKMKSVASPQERLVKLNSKAWAIQMGSFKSKDNARALADKLRVAGFKAFTKEVTSAKGTVQTRVYVGPEFKQASAIKLSQDVQKATNLQGVVVSYKPLAL